MSKNQTAEKGIFNWPVIHVSEVKKYANALQDLVFNRQIDGMIIREVLPQNIVEQVVQYLEQGGGEMKDIFVDESAMPEDMGYKPPRLYGLPIVGCGADLTQYFAYASIFRQACRKLFQGNPDFEERLESVFHSLSGGLPVEIPTGPEGQTYSSATIRVLPEGHEIAVHVGNEFLGLPEARHLKTIVNITDQLSYFIPLSVPEAGGELVVYTLEWNAEERSNKTAEIHHSVEHLLTQHQSMAFQPGPGDMLLFDGGRYYHRVTQVVGSKPRRTIGGFLAFSQGNDKVYYWS